MTSDVELLFMCLYAVCKMLKSFAHFKVVFYYYVYDFFIYLDMNSLSDMFSFFFCQPVALSFHFLSSDF